MGVSMPDELVPHVDQHDHFLELVTRAKAYREGLAHRSVHGLVQNTKGQFLLQQRSFNKQTWPGKWDLSFGETVRGMETFETACERGIKEELGIDLTGLPAQPLPIYQQRYFEYEYPPYKVYGVICLYLLTYDGKIALTDGEVAQTAWKTASEITDFISNHSEQCTPWLIHDWQYFLKQK